MLLYTFNPNTWEEEANQAVWQNLNLGEAVHSSFFYSSNQPNSLLTRDEDDIVVLTAFAIS